MVSLIMLLIELLLDAVGFITGIFVLFKFSGKGLQRVWSFLAISLSALLLYDNIEWFYIFREEVSHGVRWVELPLDHLSLWHIFRSVIFFQLYSLFPTATVRPGWLTVSTAISLCIPAVLISCVAFCYENFNSQYTDLKSFYDILYNIENQDVIVRLVLFAASVIAPTVTFLLPFFKGWVSFRQGLNKAIRFYIISFSLIMAGYCWLMLGTTSLSFNVFGYVVILPVVYMNLLHLCRRSPFTSESLAITGDPSDSDIPDAELCVSPSDEEIKESPVIIELATCLRKLMEDEQPFTDPGYRLTDLLKALGTNEHRLNRVLRYEGFTGFREYINFNRLNYFKEQAAARRELTVKELMFISGFTSRSSFYRYFSAMENISPSEYLEKLKTEDPAAL